MQSPVYSSFVHGPSLILTHILMLTPKAIFIQNEASHILYWCMHARNTIAHTRNHEGEDLLIDSGLRGLEAGDHWRGSAELVRGECQRHHHVRLPARQKRYICKLMRCWLHWRNLLRCECSCAVLVCACHHMDQFETGSECRMQVICYTWFTLWHLIDDILQSCSCFGLQCWSKQPHSTVSILIWK